MFCLKKAQFIISCFILPVDYIKAVIYIRHILLTWCCLQFKKEKKKQEKWKHSIW